MEPLILTIRAIGDLVLSLEILRVLGFEVDGTVDSSRLDSKNSLNAWYGQGLARS
jgi:hypothetical protein